MSSLNKWRRPTPSWLLSQVHGSRMQFRSLSIMKIRKKKPNLTRHLFHILQDKLFFMPTNSRRLAYLNLDDSGLFIERVYHEHDSVDALLKDESLKHHPLLDYTKFTIRRLDVCYDNVILHNMEAEKDYHRCESLIKQWDSAKFLNHINIQFDLYSGSSIEYLSSLCIENINIMMSHDIADSKLIANIFKIIIQEVEFSRNGSFLEDLSLDQLKFYTWHLNRSKLVRSFAYENWFRNRDPLFLALCSGDKKRVMELVNINYPSLYLPNFMEMYFSDMMSDREAQISDIWPVKKGDVIYGSSHSRAYYIELAMLLTDHLYCENGYNEYWKFKSAFQVLWQLLPTPYLPIEDMRECMLRLVRKSNRCHVEVVQENEVWTRVEDFFSDDFPYEYKPRSLLHLSRCAIRQTCPWPEQIAALPVPQPIKDYLNLEKRKACR